MKKPPAFAMLNQTRAHPGIARESKFQGPGMSHQTHSLTLDSGTEHELCSCPVLSCRELDMVRAVVEEAATLASLALFLGMIAIWAQVIATL